MTSKVMVTLFSLFAELERDLLGLRAKEALAAKKAQGVQLGNPQGVIQASVYDKDRERIVELLSLGLSAGIIITRHLPYGRPSSLSYYIATRNLREAAANVKRLAQVAVRTMVIILVMSRFNDNLCFLSIGKEPSV